MLTVFKSAVFLVFLLQAPGLWAASSTKSDMPVLKLAMHHNPPYYFTEDVAEPHGLSMDLLKPAARQLGIRIEIVTCPFPRCLKMAENGEVDIMAGLIRTDEREHYLRFIQPAMMNFVSSFVFYSNHSQAHEINTVQDLKDHSVAVMRDAVYFPEFDQATDINRIPVNSEATALELVHRGRADYAITVERTAAGSFAEAKMQLKDLKRQPYHVNQNIRGYLAFSRKSANFIYAEQLEQVLEKQYRTGMFHLLWQKYHLPAIPSQAQRYVTAPLSMTPAE